MRATTLLALALVLVICVWQPFLGGLLLLCFDIILNWTIVAEFQFFLNRNSKAISKSILSENDLNFETKTTKEFLLIKLRNHRKIQIYKNINPIGERYKALKEVHEQLLIKLYSKHRAHSTKQLETDLLNELLSGLNEDKVEETVDDEEHPIHVKAYNHSFYIDTLSNGVMNFFITKEVKSIESYFGSHSIFYDEYCKIYQLEEKGLIVICCENFTCEEKSAIPKCISSRAKNIHKSFGNQHASFLAKYSPNVVCYGEGNGRLLALKVANMLDNFNSRKVWAVLRREQGSWFQFLYKPTGLLDTISSILNYKSSKLRKFLREAKGWSERNDVQTIGLEYVALLDN